MKKNLIDIGKNLYQLYYTTILHNFQVCKFLCKKIKSKNCLNSYSLLVQMAGIEPARFIQPQDFKSCASASSATSAFLNWLCLTTFKIIHFILLLVNTFLKFFTTFYPLFYIFASFCLTFEQFYIILFKCKKIFLLINPKPGSLLVINILYKLN